MKKYLPVLILMYSIVHPDLSGQELALTIGSGLGSYKMNDLKDLNNIITGGLPFDSKVTENFPMYWYYKPALTYKFNPKIAAGICWSYQSTGSRISSKDYSGEYTFDNIIRASSPGILFEYDNGVGKFVITLANEAGLEFTKLNMKESLTLGAETEVNSYSFNSINYYDEPMIRISYPLSLFRFSFTAGYQIDFARGDFSYEGTDDQILKLPDDKEAKANWTGARIGLSVSYEIMGRGQNK